MYRILITTLVLASCAGNPQRRKPVERPATTVVVQSYAVADLDQGTVEMQHCYGWRITETVALTAEHCAPDGFSLGDDLAAIQVEPGPAQEFRELDPGKPVHFVHPEYGTIAGNARHWLGRVYETNAPLVPGWSGAGAFQDGYLVGIATRGRVDGPPGGDFAVFLTPEE